MTQREIKRRKHYHEMAERLRRLEEALHDASPGAEAVPKAWHEIAQTPGTGRKERVTMWVEADVLRFFRSLGLGHTTKMADVLAAFMHARLAGVVKGPEDVDYFEAERESRTRRAAQLKALGRVGRAARAALDGDVRSAERLVKAARDAQGVFEE